MFIRVINIMNMRKLVTILFISAVFSACSPIIRTQGNFINEHKFEKINTETSKRADVIQNWGPPTATSSFDQNTWYYIGETTEQRGIFEPEVTARRIIKVQFSKEDNETIASIEDIDPKNAKDISPVARKTPTAGKEFTVLQQLISNMGKYNANSGQ